MLREAADLADNGAHDINATCANSVLFSKFAGTLYGTVRTLLASCRRYLVFAAKTSARVAVT